MHHGGSSNDVGNPDDFLATFFDCQSAGLAVIRICGDFFADGNHFADGVDMREIVKRPFADEKERDEMVGDNSGKWVSWISIGKLGVWVPRYFSPEEIRLGG